MTRRYGGGSGGGGGGSASSTSTSSSGNLGADVHASLGLLPNGELKQETYVDRVARVGGIDRVGVIFLFPPVGWQRINMGRALYEKDRTFRHSIEACDAASRALLPQPLLEVLYPAPADEAMYSEVMAAPTYMLSALFAVEYALHALLRNQACEPFAVIGHSLGEFVAATVAGVLTLQSSLELVVERGRAMAAAPSLGAMLSLRAAAITAEAAIARATRAHDVAIAALNAPSACVIAGSYEGLSAVRRALPADAQSRPVRATHPDHSPLMQPVASAVGARAALLYAEAPPRAPMCLWMSTVSIGLGVSVSACVASRSTSTNALTLAATATNGSNDDASHRTSCEAGRDEVGSTALTAATAGLETGAMLLNPAHWAAHALHAVDFVTALRTVMRDFAAAPPCCCEASRTLLIVEMGEGMLARFAQEIVSEQPLGGTSVHISSLLPKEEAVASADKYDELAMRTHATIEAVMRPVRASKLQTFLHGFTPR